MILGTIDIELRVLRGRVWIKREKAHEVEAEENIDVLDKAVDANPEGRTSQNLSIGQVSLRF